MRVHQSSSNMRATLKMVLLGMATTALLSGAAIGQTAAALATTAAAPNAFIASDVQVSPYRTNPFERGGRIANGRYWLRDATMEDMIAAAYTVSPSHVFGGPPWIEWDHYDVSAIAPAGTTQAQAMKMLQALLTERFGLTVKPDTKPLPTMALMLGKGKPKLKESGEEDNPDGSSASTGECKFNPPAVKPPPGVQPDISFSCKSMSMEKLAGNLRYWGFGYYPDDGFVLDQTGLKGNYDFDLHWSQKSNMAKEGADGITIYDAIEQQLGLKLGKTTAPQPVMNIVAVNETPTPNAPDLANKMPPLPPPEFEVEVIKPSRPDETQLNGRINGGQISLQYVTPQFLITFAWQLTDEMLANPPKWMNDDHYDIEAKAAAPPPTPGAKSNAAPEFTMDDLQHMLQVMMEKRFNIKWHMEDRPVEAYTLVAVNPKLAIADPNNRTACKEGPGADGKDPRNTNPALGRLLTCTNITMAQFASQLQTQANGYVHTPVVDATGLTGHYDLTLSFSASQQLHGSAMGPGKKADDSASDPNGGLTLFEAMSRQLGLKMEKTKRPVPVLVFDHIDPKPTDN